MTKNEKKNLKASSMRVPSESSLWPDDLFYESSGLLAEKYQLAFLLVTNNTDFDSFDFKGPKPWIGKTAPKRVVIIWGPGVINPSAILSWRCGMIGIKGIAFKIIAYPQKQPADWTEWLVKELGGWANDKRKRESEGLRVGDMVSCSSSPTFGKLSDYDPSFLTIAPTGRMSEALSSLDECKRMFSEIIGEDVVGRREEVHKDLNEALALDPSLNREERGEQINSFSESVNETLNREFALDRNRLPKVLLLGPSGAGKTLVARYLAWVASPGSGRGSARAFKRIPTPEYLHRESDFEHDVFGYCAGAYSGCHPDGKKGFLLERLGGVVFFDEIGDANPAIQAKLLAYLDDYQVAPRGWSGDSFFCPMLVVAATNRPIDDWAEDKDLGDHARLFRNDLFRRFNFVVRIPSLNERKGEELIYILDVMLQMEAFNPSNKIKEVGSEALSAFMAFDYDKGNFRDLENLVRMACRRASEDGRSYLVKDDIEVGF